MKETIITATRNSKFYGVDREGFADYDHWAELIIKLPDDCTGKKYKVTYDEILEIGEIKEK